MVQVSTSLLRCPGRCLSARANGFTSDDTNGGEMPYNVDELTKARWFTRGWTLQELIAPKTVVFYAADWVMIGDKWPLGETLSTLPASMVKRYPDTSRKVSV